MPNWLIEDLGLVAILLGVGALLLAGIWWRDRRTKFLTAAVVLATLGAVAGLLWLFVDTDQRKIKRKVEEMAAGIPGDLDRVFRHISPTFRYGTRSKDDLRRAAADAIRQRNVTEVRVWDVAVEQADRATRTARVSFSFKIRGNWSAGNEFFQCRATFYLDDDGEWRMREFQVFSPTNINDPLTIPGL